MKKIETIEKLKRMRRPAFIDIDLLRNLKFQKWVLLIVLSLALSLLLAPQFSVIRPTFSVGMVPDYDIRADHDFLVEDKIATDHKKMEAARSVLRVYDYDFHTPDILAARLTQAFSLLEVRYYKAPEEVKEALNRLPQAERIKRIKGDFEQTTGIVLSDEELAVLHENAFSETLRDDLIRLIRSFRGADYLDRPLDSPGNFTVGRADTKNIVAIADLDELEDYFVKPSIAIFGKSNSALRRTAESLAAKLIKPQLMLNHIATEKHRKWVVDRIKPVYFKVKKNELIIKAGEPLAYQDLLKLEAFYSTEGGDSVFNLKVLAGFFVTILMLTIIFHQSSKGLLKALRKSNKDLLFLSIVMLLHIVIMKSGIFIAESIAQTFSLFSAETLYFALPFAWSTILIVVCLNRTVAFVFAIFSAILVTFLFEVKLPIFLYAFLGSAAPAYRMIHFRQRSAFFRSGLFAAAVNIVVVFCLTLLAGSATWLEIFLRMAMAGIGGLLSGLIVAGITPAFEALFAYTTDIKLMELCNLNQPLLQRMIVEAPGTYNHSIIVATMVEAAAESIRANPLLARVSAYYHDIGKLSKPLYFIENQQSWKNKHDRLSPKMSSLVIISHVKEGCELAKHYKLGKAISDIIQQHHGMSIVSYFYDKAQKDKDPSVRSIPQSDFRYPGPKPQTREAGLVLLGDIVEASSRTLTDPTPSRIRNLVQARIKQVFTDGQLDQCDLTMNDVNNIAESFVRTLTGIFHQRIEYAGSGNKQPTGNTDQWPYRLSTDRKK